MPEKVSYSREHEIIQIRSWGTVSMNDMLASQAEVKRLSEKHGATKIIVDGRGQVALPMTLDLFTFAKDLRHVLPSEKKLAIVQSAETVEDLRFVETVGVNRGVNVRIFHARSQAVAWLRQP